MPDPDLLRIVTDLKLRYPIVTKADFIAQAGHRPPVTFRGTPYSLALAATLLPDFFFPLDSAGDLLGKATELVASRGLATAPPSTTANRSAPLLGRALEELLGGVEGVVTDTSRAANDPARVDALDVVTHALELVSPPRALALWRAAAAGEFRPEARAAVATMLDHVRAAIDRGDRQAVTSICECLFDLFDHVAPAPVGGWRAQQPPQSAGRPVRPVHPHTGVKETA